MPPSPSRRLLRRWYEGPAEADSKSMQLRTDLAGNAAVHPSATAFTWLCFTRKVTPQVGRLGSTRWQLRLMQSEVWPECLEAATYS